MAKTPKRLHGPSPATNAAATAYTVPAGTKTILRHIHVSNTNAGAVGFTLSIGADSAGTRIYDAYSIAAGSVLDVWCYYVLEVGDIIQRFASVNGVLVVTLDGDELTLG